MGTCFLASSASNNCSKAVLIVMKRGGKYINFPVDMEL